MAYKNRLRQLKCFNIINHNNNLVWHVYLGPNTALYLIYHKSTNTAVNRQVSDKDECFNINLVLYNHLPVCFTTIFLIYKHGLSSHFNLRQTVAMPGHFLFIISSLIKNYIYNI